MTSDGSWWGADETKPKEPFFLLQSNFPDNLYQMPPTIPRVLPAAEMDRYRKGLTECSARSEMTSQAVDQCTNELDEFEKRENMQCHWTDNGKFRSENHHAGFALYLPDENLSDGKEDREYAINL